MLSLSVAASTHVPPAFLRVTPHTSLTWASNLRDASSWLSTFEATAAAPPPPASPLLRPPFSAAPFWAGAASGRRLLLPPLLVFLVLLPPPVTDEVVIVGPAPPAAVLPLPLHLPSSCAIFDRSKTSFDGTNDWVVLRERMLRRMGGTV